MPESCFLESHRGVSYPVETYMDGEKNFVVDLGLVDFSGFTDFLLSIML